jgi:hypothetical protein
VEGLRKLERCSQQGARWGLQRALQAGHGGRVLVHVGIQLEGRLRLGLGVLRGGASDMLLSEQLGLPPALEGIDHCDVCPQSSGVCVWQESGYEPEAGCGNVGGNGARDNGGLLGAGASVGVRGGVC